MKRAVFLLLTLFCCGLTGLLIADSSPDGYWKSVDESGKVTAYWKFETYSGGNKLRGKIVRVPGQSNDTKCTECTKDNGGDKVAEYYNKPIVGTYWAWGMTKDGDKWTGGRIIDSGAGKMYYVKVWVENGDLMVKGSLDRWGAVGRSQTWKRATQSEAMGN